MAADDDSAGDIEARQGILDDGTSRPFVAIQSLSGATFGAGCEQATPTVVGCIGDFDAVVVIGNGGDDKITLKLIADGRPPLHGEASGDAGNDTLKAPPDFRDVPQPETYMEGGAGNDTIVGGNGTDELHGGDGNDTMQGFEGADVLRGDGGDDSVSGGKEEPETNAADVVDGGPGFDSIPDVDADYNRGYDDDVSVTLDGVANDGEAGENDNVIGVEKLLVSAGHATIVGSDAAERVHRRREQQRREGHGRQRPARSPGTAPTRSRAATATTSSRAASATTCSTVARASTSSTATARRPT